MATLGDWTLGFNGGLTLGPGGTLYGIANDSTCAGSLYSIQSNGTLSLVGAASGIGFGFLGGLAYNPGASLFYAAVQDSLGNDTLDSISTAGVATANGLALGAGFSGLAFDTGNGLLFGIGNDNSGFSTLYDFSLSGPVTAVIGLGFGFGALTYEAANNVFWAIAPVNNAGSQLFQVSPAGAVSAPFAGAGSVPMVNPSFEAPAVAPSIMTVQRYTGLHSRCSGEGSIRCLQPHTDRGVTNRRPSGRLHAYRSAMLVRSAQRVILWAALPLLLSRPITPSPSAGRPRAEIPVYCLCSMAQTSGSGYWVFKPPVVSLDLSPGSRPVQGGHRRLRRCR